VSLGDPVDRAAALGAGLVGADLAGAGGFDREAQLLLERAGGGAADGVMLPAGGLGDLLDRGALGTLEHLDHPGLLGAGARRGLGGRLTGGLGLVGGWRGLGGLLAPASGRRGGTVSLAGGRRGLSRTVGLAPRAYQVNAQVGRGFAAELDLENSGTVSIVGGEPDAAGTCGSSRSFTSADTLAQQYTAGAAGDLVSVSLYFSGTGTPNVRVGVYSDNGGLPDALLAEGTGVAPGGSGWHEIDLATPVAVADTDVIWVAAQVSANINSCSPSSVANTGRRLNSQGYASGLADPFGSSSSYSNTRGMRYKIEVNQ
jgi:hypothetical protein